MAGYGSSAGIAFNFHFPGTITDATNVRRLIQHYQKTIRPETANKIVNSLYSQYFELGARRSPFVTGDAAGCGLGWGRG